MIVAGNLNSARSAGRGGEVTEKHKQESRNGIKNIESKKIIAFSS